MKAHLVLILFWICLDAKKFSIKVRRSHHPIAQHHLPGHKSNCDRLRFDVELFRQHTWADDGRLWFEGSGLPA